MDTPPFPNLNFLPRKIAGFPGSLRLQQIPSGGRVSATHPGFPDPIEGWKDGGESDAIAICPKDEQNFGDGCEVFQHTKIKHQQKAGVFCWFSVGWFSRNPIVDFWRIFAVEPVGFHLISTSSPDFFQGIIAEVSGGWWRGRACWSLPLILQGDPHLVETTPDPN